MIVQTKDGLATVPADNFAVSGNALISAMGEGALRQEARNDQAASKAAPAGKGHRNADKAREAKGARPTA